MKLFSLSLAAALTVAATSSYAANNVQGTWKLTNIACKSGGSASALGRALIDKAVLVNTENTSTLTLVIGNCTIVQTSSYTLSGNTISSSNARNSYGPNCGEVSNKSGVPSPDSTSPYTISGNVASVEDAAKDNGICPVGDVIVSTYIRM